MDKIIMDTAGFLAGLENAFPKVYTTEEVILEVRDRSSRLSLDMAVSSGKVSVFAPRESSLKQALKFARQVGEDTLSEADLSVIALALEMKPCLVLTDDFSVQNVLKFIGVDYRSVKLNRRVGEVRDFEYVCEGCGKTYENKVKECAVCGNQVVKRGKRR